MKKISKNSASFVIVFTHYHLNSHNNINVTINIICIQFHTVQIIFCIIYSFISFIPFWYTSHEMFMCSFQISKLMFRIYNCGAIYLKAKGIREFMPFIRLLVQKWTQQHNRSLNLLITMSQSSIFTIWTLPKCTDEFFQLIRHLYLHGK